MTNNNPIRKVREDIKNCLNRNQDSPSDNIKEALQGILDYIQEENKELVECGNCHKKVKKSEIEIKSAIKGCIEVPSPYCQKCASQTYVNPN